MTDAAHTLPGRRRGESDGKRRRQRVTPHSLERWALHHLDRYATSAANLRAVLARRVRRIEQAQEEQFAEAPTWIEETVDDLLSRGYLDDRKYAVSLAQQMRARGASARRILDRLGKKGVPWEIAREALAQASGDGGELQAAVRYAKRRSLGPYRVDPEVRAARRERDLAALGRSGFSYEVASRIIEAAGSDGLESSVGKPQ